MPGSDESVQREILRQVYDEHEQTIRRGGGFDSINEELDHIPEDEIVYHPHRLEDHRFVETQGHIGQKISSVEITAGGWINCMRMVMRRFSTMIYGT